MRHPGQSVFLLLLLCLLCCPTPGSAEGFKPGNLLVSAGFVYGGYASAPINTVFEFDGGGTLRQTLPVPAPLSGTESVRTLCMDYLGDLHAYNGTFTPSLATYDPRAGWTQRTLDGWSTENNITFGGVAAYKNDVFATDMATADSGPASGVIRFNMVDGTTERFADGTDFETLQMGYDGLLYAINGSSGINTVIFVFNPEDMTQVKTIYAPLDFYGGDFRSVAVNSKGDLFLVGLSGVIYHCDNNGNTLNTLNMSKGRMLSLALSTDGRIAVACEDGTVVMTDESLLSFTTFQAYSAPDATAWTMYVAFVPYRSQPCDFNGDGKADFLWQNQATGDLSYWFMNGTQFTSSGYVARNIPLDWQPVGTPDLNNDGKADILWRNQATGDITYWLMNGTQFVSSGYVAQGIPLEWKIMGTPDLNGDGKPDILWQNQRTGNITYWLMNGTQFVSSGYIAYNIPLEWQIVGTADLDGDGNVDILWRNQNTGDGSYWLMNGTNSIGWGYFATAVPLEWKLVGTPDLNGDGKADLVWQNQSTGDISYWLMDNTRFVSGDYMAHSIPLQWQLTAAH